MARDTRQVAEAQAPSGPEASCSPRARSPPAAGPPSPVKPAAAEYYSAAPSDDSRVPAAARQERSSWEPAPPPAAAAGYGSSGPPAAAAPRAVLQPPGEARHGQVGGLVVPADGACMPCSVLGSGSSVQLSAAVHPACLRPACRRSSRAEWPGLVPLYAGLQRSQSAMHAAGKQAVHACSSSTRPRASVPSLLHHPRRLRHQSCHPGAPRPAPTTLATTPLTTTMWWSTCQTTTTAGQTTTTATTTATRSTTQTTGHTTCPARAQARPWPTRLHTRSHAMPRCCTAPLALPARTRPSHGTGPRQAGHHQAPPGMTGVWGPGQCRTRGQEARQLQGQLSRCRTPLPSGSSWSSTCTAGRRLPEPWGQ